LTKHPSAVLPNPILLSKCPSEGAFKHKHQKT
jgi:hypothetical protein